MDFDRYFCPIGLNDIKITVTKMSEHYLLVGLGKTGLSAARFLTRHNKKFIAFDTRHSLDNIDTIAREFAHIDITLGRHHDINWDAIHTVIASPGVSHEEDIIIEAKKNNVHVIGDVELFARHNKKPVIGITGTNGKSSVTQLVGDIIHASGQKAAICGNIGQPILDVSDKDYDVYVVELSSFQLETTHTLALDVACILNISPDHLDRHKTLENYIEAKRRIFHHAKKAVINFNDKHTQPLEDKLETLSFGLSSKADFYFNDNQLVFQGKSFLAASSLKIVGTHNILNALAASAICYMFGVSIEHIIEGLKNFAGLAHRCQWVAENRGVTWINDSKGTNVGATIAALKGLGAKDKKNIIWIAGGQGKGADFSELSEYARSYVRKVVLFGEDKEKIKQALDESLDVATTADLQAAIAEAEQSAKSGDIVLFSPACASFDMFKSFVERGEVFMRLVAAL